MPTLSQIKTIQLGRKVCNLTDAAYRTLLRSVAGVESCKDLSNAGVEDVMAVLEGQGFDSHPSGKTYWRDKVDRRGSVANERMVHLVRELAGGEGARRYDLGALATRQSGGRTDRVEQLLPREAWMLIEGLKAMNAREAGRLRKEEGSAAAGAGQRAAAGTDARELGGPDGGRDAATLF